jgi:valyl-tRNA synthetase
MALSVQLRLLAPFLPYVTEEVWSWWHEGSVHRAPWPEVGELSCARAASPGPDVLAVTVEVLGEVRRVKTAAKQSMRARVERLEVIDSPERIGAVRAASVDLREAGGVDELVLVEGESRRVHVVLLPDER